MSKLAAENLWWPACTMTQTTVIEGDPMFHNLPDDQNPVIEHTYSMQQTATAIHLVCPCGRKLSRYKYPREFAITPHHISRR